MMEAEQWGMGALRISEATDRDREVLKHSWGYT